MLDEKLLKNEERAVYSLRSLYSRFGYSCFKMSKFEEYELYVRNKDFLISDGIITFTDTNGKLMALKPDVTLSIIKNSADREGEVQKLYYDENVYRISGGSGSFKEITQTGLECFGDISMYDVCEVLTLAVKSLEMIDTDYIIDISHAGFVSALLDSLGLKDSARKKVSTAVRKKSRDEIDRLVAEGEITENAAEVAKKLIASYKDCETLNGAFSENGDPTVTAALKEFTDIYNALSSLGLAERLNIDFSIVNDTSYYSGVVFKGYIKGIPSEVLSGGRYDKLMRQMGRSSGAVGFAVYLDVLERHKLERCDYDYDVILINDGSADTSDVIKEVERLSKNGDSVAVFKKKPQNARSREMLRLIGGRLEKCYGNN